MRSEKGKKARIRATKKIGMLLCALFSRMDSSQAGDARANESKRSMLEPSLSEKAGAGNQNLGEGARPSHVNLGSHQQTVFCVLLSTLQRASPLQ